MNVINHLQSKNEYPGLNVFVQLRIHDPDECNCNSL